MELIDNSLATFDSYDNGGLWKNMRRRASPRRRRRRSTLQIASYPPSPPSPPPNSGLWRWGTSPTLSTNHLTIATSNHPIPCWNRSIRKLRSLFNESFLGQQPSRCLLSCMGMGWMSHLHDYYARAEHLTGEALRKQLNSIVRGHRSLSYKEVWNALKILDAAEGDQPEASPAIVEVYSLRIVPKKLGGKPEGWNREHLWPRSYGLTHGPSLTDLHNIRPADVNVNSSRGNKYFGEYYLDPSRFCLMPANKEAAPDSETDKRRWAQHSKETDGSAGTRPPSREEKLRNERICRLFQHNRNPFVDHPEYTNLIRSNPISNRQKTQRIIKQGPANSTTTMEVHPQMRCDFHVAAASGS
ncbi:Extracellular ribonuclease-like protein [Drosera capensis]